MSAANANLDVDVRLAPGAEENGLAQMFSDLLRQNLEARPVARARFAAMRGRIVLHARDAEVTMTLDFRAGYVVVHDGALPSPDATIEADADAIVTMSRLPLRTRWELPLFDPRDSRDRDAFEAWRVVLRENQVHTVAHHPRAIPLLVRFTSVLSVGT
jgi:hypothetical protein